MGAKSQRKGRAAELELSRILQGHGYPVEAGRAQSYGEVPDLSGLPGIHIECKRAETLRLSEWMGQAERDAQRFGDGVPAVFFRRSRSPWCVVMKLEDWMELYRSYRPLEHSNHKGQAMYCVIQQVMRKKPSPYGEYREIEVYQNEWRITGDDRPCTWSYRYAGGRFERPHLEVYKITLHQSYREGGVVKKRQYTVCTMSCYDICESWWGDHIVGAENALAEKVGIAPAELYELIETKLGPLRERLEAEFHRSPEYIAKQEHERIIADHMTAQNEFCSKYDVDKDEYNRCYDVFGVLRNKDYLEKIKAHHKARKESERRYRESWSSTYDWYTSGGYSVPSVSTYTEEETALLKKFYRSLTKTYHPDLNPDEDTTAEMQLLNRLKEQWGV